MAGEQSWGGIMSTFEDCVLLLDNNTVSAPWISHGRFDDTLVCPGQLNLEQHYTESKNEEADSTQSPSDSAWETVDDSDIDELEDSSTAPYDDDGIDESAGGYGNWKEFLDMVGYGAYPAY